MGAFGRNHARVYHELQQAGECELVAVIDASAERGEAIAGQFGTRAFTSIEQALGSVEIDAATVAVPTIHHVSVASEMMGRGIDVLIEKPVADTLEGADSLIQLARANNRVAMVGHLERFNPAVRAAMKVITAPMFFEVHRLSLFGPRALDVDVVLDLMIHDLDVVLTLAKSEVKEIRAVGLPILSGKVDIANVRMEFESGAVANFTASRVSTERVRKLRFFQPREYVSVDYTRQDVLVLSVNAEMLASGQVAPEQLAALIGARKPEVTPEEPLRAEIRAFLDAVRTRSTPAIPLEDGRRALAVALEILREVGSHRQRLGLDHMLGVAR